MEEASKPPRGCIVAQPAIHYRLDMKATSTPGLGRITLCGITLCGMALCFGLAHRADAQSSGATRPSGSAGSVAAPAPSGEGPIFGAPTTLPYAREFPAIPYAQMPADNAIARLQARIDRGQVKLVYQAPRGYLDSILSALGIDPTSQTLVYSKTSLQKGEISAATPRAIYFNDDTYVAWVQGGDLELAAMDSKLGQVFYTLANQPVQTVRLERQTTECLSCHDTYELSGGGVPRFLLMSTYVDVQGEELSHEGQILTFQETPLKYRWGGWYVTGQSGEQVHLGNILVHNAQQMAHLDQVRRGNLDTLRGLFNTKPYRTDKSDIVALLVLQHQKDVQNLITRVNFEVRTALAKAGSGRVPDEKRATLEGYMDGLVSVMFFVEATPFTSPISGNSGFTQAFQARGPRDPMGRSLRDFDLKTGLFKYPLSYLVYSQAFNALPSYAKDYLYGRFADILSGRSASDAAAGTLPRGFDPDALDAYIDQDAKAGVPQLTDTERKSILEILRTTKPDFARYLATHGSREARVASRR